jgi:hypothetical protein
MRRCSGLIDQDQEVDQRSAPAFVNKTASCPPRHSFDHQTSRPHFPCDLSRCHPYSTRLCAQLEGMVAGVAHATPQVIAIRSLLLSL